MPGNSFLNFSHRLFILLLLFGRSCVIVGHHRLTDELFPAAAVLKFTFANVFNTSNSRFMSSSCRILMSVLSPSSLYVCRRSARSLSECYGQVWIGQG